MKLAIGVVTFRRTEMALETIRSTIENLNFPKDQRAWYIADDGSDREHIEKILSLLRENGEELIGYHTEKMRRRGEENSFHAGLGWNRCLGNCHQYSDYVLWLEDDWKLDEPLDMTRYMNVLESRDDVGAISFRILSAGANVHTVGYNGEIYLQYLRDTQYAYSGNPHLRHARFTNQYGWFADDRNPGLIELHMDDQYRLREGSWIWRPASISIWGSWKHEGSIKTWS